MSVLFLELSGFSTATWPDVMIVSRTCHVTAGAGLCAWRLPPLPCWRSGTAREAGGGRGFSPALVTPHIDWIILIAAAWVGMCHNPPAPNQTWSEVPWHQQLKDLG